MPETETETQDDDASTDAVEETIEEGRETVEEVTEDARETVEDARDRVEEATEDARETVEETVDEGLEAVNDNLVDALSSVLDTRARADVYVALRGLDEATVDEIAERTGLYPETVEETLADLEDDEIVTSDEVGGEEFYTAISPTEAVASLPQRLGDRISELFSVGEDGRELSPEWAPFRLIVEPKDEDAETEIAVE